MTDREVVEKMIKELPERAKWGEINYADLEPMKQALQNLLTKAKKAGEYQEDAAHREMDNVSLKKKNEELHNSLTRSWKALGITEYTGKSISEHIEQLQQQLSRLDGIEGVIKKVKSILQKIMIMMEDEIVNFDTYGLSQNDINDLLELLKKEKK